MPNTEKSIAKTGQNHNTDPLHTLANRLEGVRWNGDDEFIARCPAHPDNNPSLSVSRGDKQPVVMTCHAGCTTEQILSALNMTWADISDNSTTNTGRRKSKPTVTNTVAYDYTDADGNLLFQAVRQNMSDGGKQFRQRQPDGHGGWVYNLKGVERTLYQLPALMASGADEWVFLPEGEKDVDNLQASGLTATCNPMGAGKWLKRYSGILAGRKVCILPDNDDVGRKHAVRAAESLIDSAADVRVLHLPGLPAKGDVSDWLGNGGDAGTLASMADSAPKAGDWLNDTAQSKVTDSEPDSGSDDKIDKATAVTNVLIELGDFRYNLLRDQIELNGEPVHDGDEAEIIAQVYKRGQSGVQMIKLMMMRIAYANKYDPLVDWLTGLQWDGQDHIRALSDCILDRHEPIEYPDGTLHKVFEVWFERWIVGAVHKALTGEQNPMLVLAGEQGIGKSKFAEWLASPVMQYFVSSPIVPDSKDHLRMLTGNFLWEVDELSGTTRKADVDKLKAFLSRKECTYRVPYAKHETHQTARASFIGTLNPDNTGFLHDVTGNRRFLTVEVGFFNWENYTANIDPSQVWAQAVALHKSEPGRATLNPTEIEFRDKINDQHGQDDPVMDALVGLYDITPDAHPDSGAPFVTTQDILQAIKLRVHVSSDVQLQRMINQAMRRLHTTKGRQGSLRGYFGVRRLV